jgi:hypothetical protein
MRPSVALEEAPVGRLLSQRMAKDVYDPIADDALIGQPEPSDRPLGWIGLSPRGRRRVAAKVRRVHHLVGEDIDDPGAQYGTNSRTRDIFFTALGDRPGRRAPANTSTRFNLHRPISPSLSARWTR